MSTRWTAKSPMSGYLVAIAATLTVLLLRLLFSPILGDSAYFFPFVIAVTLSAWYGGFNPGLLAAVLGSIFAVCETIGCEFASERPGSHDDGETVVSHGAPGR